MIAWMHTQPSTFEHLREDARKFGRIRVYSVDRRSGAWVVETYAGQEPVQPIFDGSREERGRLIARTKPVSWIIEHLARQQERMARMGGPQ